MPETTSYQELNKQIWRIALEKSLFPEVSDLIMERSSGRVHRARAEAYRDAARLVDETYISEQDNLFLQIAQVLELAERLAKEDHGVSVLRGRVLNTILSSLAYECGGSPANARLLSDRAESLWRQVKKDGTGNQGPFAEVERAVFECALAVQHNDLFSVSATSRDLIEQLSELESAILDHFDNDGFSRADLENFAAQVLMLRGFSSYADGLINLNGKSQPDLVFFRDAAELFEHLGSSSYWLLSRFLAIALEKSVQASTAKLLQRFFRGPEEKRYVESLLSKRRKVFKLWPSQVYAIEQGVLDTDKTHIALSLPTSAGKTLIAESVIARELLKDSNARCVYLAPTRALVTEVEQTLKRSLAPLGIQVTQIAAAPELSVIESELALENRLLCLTPEKLDVLLRLEHEILGSIRLIIIDEGQLLEESKRGQILEFAVVKLQLRYPSTRFLFLSAVIPNIDEISQWLGAQEHSSGHILSEWRPTRLRIGEALMENVSQADILDDPVLEALNSQKPRLIKRCRVQYTNGEKIDAFFVRYGQAKDFHNNQQIVAGLAVAYANRGNVLVLTTSKSRAENIADLLSSQLRPLEDQNLQLLAAKIRREVDQEFPLANHVETGVAYHHGDLPPRIRYRIERAARNNELRFIVATTTLAEGVNLPVSTLIVDDLNFRRKSGDSWLLERMSARKFWNLAGRAGRALVDTEGHVIILDADRFFDTSEEKRAFLTPQISALEPVESVFLQLIKLLEGRYRQLLSFDYSSDPFQNLTAVQNFLLALLDLEDILADNLDPDLAIENIVKHSLITYQRDASAAHKKHFRNFVRWGFGIVRTYTELPKHEKRLIVRLGIAIRSALELKDSLNKLTTEILEQLLYDIRANGELNSDVLRIIYSKAFAIPEIKPDRYSSAPHELIAIDWIQGTTVSQIAKDYFSDAKRPLGAAVNYLQGTQALMGAWGISAVVSVLGYILEERGVVLDPELLGFEISLLPAYSAYGVDSAAAAKFAARGMERVDSCILADWFYEDIGLDKGSTPLALDCMEWLRSRPHDELELRIREHHGSFDEEILNVIRD